MNQQAINEQARLTLEGLTPGGSEYVNDPERCAAYIQSVKHDCVEANKQVVRQRRTLDEAKAALHAAYEELSQKEVDRACRVETLAMVKQALTDMEG